jgi:hypothetical protein
VYTFSAHTKILAIPTAGTQVYIAKVIMLLYVETSKIILSLFASSFSIVPAHDSPSVLLLRNRFQFLFQLIDFISQFLPLLLDFLVVFFRNLTLCKLKSFVI